MSNKIFDRLGYDALRAAEDFQRFVSEAYRLRSYSGTAKISEAKYLIGLVASALREQCGLDNLLEDVPQALHIRVKQFCLKGSDGCLASDSHGFELLLSTERKGVLSLKEQLIVAHECGHSLFYYWNPTATRQEPDRLVPRMLDNPWEEDLCDHFAHVLLGLQPGTVKLR